MINLYENLLSFQITGPDFRKKGTTNGRLSRCIFLLLLIKLNETVMNKEFEPIVQGIVTLLNEWEPKFAALQEAVITQRRNNQNRTIKQIVGHMIDSASNNTHRIVHLQYQPSPFRFPNYASNGNNDRWIAIQNYQEEDWKDMVNLWKYANLHYVHVVKNILPAKLENQWHCSEDRLISLKDGVIDYLRHFKLHLGEIDELIHA
jgi:hypothetical protein